MTQITNNTSQKPKNEVVEILFFKESGKMYSSGTFTTDHYEFEEGFLLDIIDNQSALHKDWFLRNDFIVVTNSLPTSNFHHTKLIYVNDLRDAYHLRELKNKGGN